MFNYKCFDRFLLRTPLLPLDYIQSIFKNEDTEFDILKKVCSNEFIKESIFLASQELYNQ